MFLINRYKKCNFRRFFIFALLLVSSHFSYANQNDIEPLIQQIQNESDKSKAIELADSLLESQDLTLNQKHQITVDKSMAYFALGDLKLALSTMEEAVVLAQKARLREPRGYAHKMVGVFNYYSGNYLEAIEAYNKSLSFYPKTQFPIKHANLMNNIALSYSLLANSHQALVYYKEAETLYQKYGTIRDQNDVRHNIGVLYLKLKRYDIARELFEEVLKIRLELSDHEDVAKVQSDLGIVHKQSGNYQTAENYYLDALNYYLEHDDKYAIAGVKQNLAELSLHLNHLEDAETYVNEALKLAKEKNHSDAYASALMTKAKLLFSQGKLDESKRLFEESRALAFSKGSQEPILVNLAFESLIHAGNRDYKASLSAYLAHYLETNKFSNNELNELLANFESQQLKQKLSQLEQEDILDELKREQNEQRMLFAFICLIMFFLIVIFIFRRNHERRLKEELEVKVKERTTSLEKLAEELKQANEIKSQFLANVSHEIRTPLTAIIGQAEAIEKGDVEEDYILEEVEVIHHNGIHLLELINQILDISKIEADKVEVDYRSYDLLSIVQEVEQIFLENAKTKDLHFDVRYALPESCIVKIDAFRLKQILINLCSNAIKFTEKGNVQFTVSLDGSNIEFKVSDTGIGMTPAQLEKVFDNFTQGDSSITRRFGGSGLGLYLSERIAKLMKGSITVESKPGIGSTFVLKVPFVEGNFADVDTTLNQKQLTTNQEEYTIEGSVLLAEDHIDNRRLIARLLSRLGLHVITAKNGTEAVELALKHEPELILLDIQMPEMDGLEAFSLLREKGNTAPIIAITANAMTHEIESYLSHGFDAYLKKPIERENFINTIVNYFPKKTTVSALHDKLSNVDISDLEKQFANSLSAERDKIKRFAAERDFEALEACLHQLAGAAKMFGYAEISEISLNIERTLKSGSIDINELLVSLVDSMSNPQRS